MNFFITLAEVSLIIIGVLIVVVFLLISLLSLLAGAMSKRKDD